MTQNPPLKLRAESTALVLIDLQQGVTSRQVSPHSAAEVVDRASKLAALFRERQAVVVLVRVAFSEDDRDRLKPPSDVPPPNAPFPPAFSELVPALGRQEGDVIITKRQWGAFYGTELELQLRRRTIDTVVLAGISTNFGVESTARDAFERGFSLVFVEDAMAGLTADAHQFAVSTIFPRLGRVRSTSEVLASLGGD